MPTPTRTPARPTPAAQRIIRFSVDAPVTSADGKPRSWIMLLPVGTVQDSRYGEITITRTLCGELKQSFDERVRRIDIALDVDHDAGQATGWLEQVEFRDGLGGQPDGLWGLVRWTPYGVQLLTEEIYRYFSIEFTPNYTDPLDGRECGAVILGGGLTNRPVMKQMPAVTLSEISRKPWGSINKAQLPRACFLIQGDPNDKKTWKLPVYEGAGSRDATGQYPRRGALNINGVRAAAQAIGGARTGKPMAGIPASVVNRLARWLTKYDANGSDGDSHQTTETQTAAETAGRVAATERTVARKGQQVKKPTKNAQNSLNEQHAHTHPHPEDEQDEQDAIVIFADDEDLDEQDELDAGDETFAEDDGAEMEYDEGEDRHGAMTTKSHSHGKYGPHAHADDGDHSDAPLTGDGDAEDAQDGGADEASEDMEMSRGGGKPRKMMGVPGARTKKTMSERDHRDQRDPENKQLRERLAQLEFKLYEKSVDETLSGWERRTYTFREGKQTRQGRIALSKAFKEKVRAFMLGGETLRLSERGRQSVLSLVEDALSGAIVDMEQRAVSFDQESRRTLRAGERAGSPVDDSEKLEREAQSLALSEQGKPLHELDSAAQMAVYERAAKKVGYR